MNLGRAKRGRAEGGKSDRFEEDEPEKTLHATLRLDAVLTAGCSHSTAVVDVERDEKEAGQDVAEEEPAYC